MDQTKTYFSHVEADKTLADKKKHKHPATLVESSSTRERAATYPPLGGSTAQHKRRMACFLIFFSIDRSPGSRVCLALLVCTHTHPPPGESIVYVQLGPFPHKHQTYSSTVPAKDDVMEVSVLENLRPLRHAPLDDRPHLLDAQYAATKFKRGCACLTAVLASTLLTGCVFR